MVVSTFTSAQERVVLRRVLERGWRVMAVLPGGIPAEEALPEGLAAACREGRGLLLSPQAAGSPLTKKVAMWCNEYVLRHADEIWTGTVAEGGILRGILRGLGKWD